VEIVQQVESMRAGVANAMDEGGAHRFEMKARTRATTPFESEVDAHRPSSSFIQYNPSKSAQPTDTKQSEAV
jgi:hypothetical protein